MVFRSITTASTRPARTVASWCAIRARPRTSSRTTSYAARTATASTWGRWQTRTGLTPTTTASTSLEPAMWPRSQLRTTRPWPTGRRRQFTMTPAPRVRLLGPTPPAQTTPSRHPTTEPPALESRTTSWAAPERLLRIVGATSMSFLPHPPTPRRARTAAPRSPWVGRTTPTSKPDLRLTAPPTPEGRRARSCLSIPQQQGSPPGPIRA